MSIEIHEPELEALILERMVKDGFHSVEDVLKAVFKLHSEEDSLYPSESERKPKESLDQMFAKARGLFMNEDTDLLFRRDPSPGRPVDLS